MERKKSLGPRCQYQTNSFGGGECARPVCRVLIVWEYPVEDGSPGEYTSVLVCPEHYQVAQGREEYPITWDFDVRYRNWEYPA